MTVDVVATHHATLGEGPVWDDRLGCLYWVDIEQGLVLRWSEDGGEDRWETGTRVGSLGLTTDPGRLVIALERQFALLVLGSGKITPLPMPEPIAANTRFNDGKCDPFGGFVAGTMSEADPRASNGVLYRLAPDLNVTRLASGIAVSNSIAWDGIGQHMVFADLPDRKLRVYKYAKGRNPLPEPDVIRHFGADEGVPDGSTLDQNAVVWTAMWDGRAVARTGLDGTLQAPLALPVSRPTSCTFGGPGLRDLYITTATFGYSDAQIAGEPLAGRILRLREAGSGLPAGRFRLP